jgi:hypothetical protein
MKKLKLFISLWFTMFSVAIFAQAEFEKIAITQNTLDNSAGRLIVQDATTGELKYILKSVLDNKFNQPTGNATQYLDGAGTPTAFPVLGQADRVITEVRNTTGATVVKGTVVYLSGASGGKATIQKAQANSELTSSGTFGVIQSDINNNSNGYAVVIGTVLGVNTSSYTEGQVLWLSPTVAGGFTSTKPVAPNHAVYVAIVTLAATNGTIEVKVQNGYEIDELHDVLITSKANNDAIVYDSVSGLWKNKQLVADAIADGTTTVAPSQNAVFEALAAKENTSSKNVANGYAGLGSDGKLFSTQLPSITITDTFVVGSQAAMLALTAETGDVAVRTDLNKTYILKGTDPAVLANWQELLTPTSAVTSVFGRNGVVTAQNGDYTTALVTETTNKRYQSDIQQAYNDATSSIQSQLDAKEPSIAAPGTTGQYWRGNKTFATLDTSVIPENGSLFFTNDRAKIAVTGNSGSINYVSKFTSNGTIGNSQIFDNGTKVGIGTATPSEKLDVIGNIKIGAGNKLQFSSTAYITPENNVSGAEITTGGILTIKTGGTTERVRVDGSGNVGIGTQSPNFPLTIFNGSNNASIHLKRTDAPVSSWYMHSGRLGGGELSFGDDNSYRMVLNSSGDLALGTTIALTGGGSSKWITANGTEAYSGGLIGAINGVAKMYLYSESGFVRVQGTTGEGIRLETNGGISALSIASNQVATFSSTVTATGFFQSSDLRLKDIISRDGDVIKYKWKDKRDDKIHIGYVAQEVQKENPEQVNTDDKGMLSVNYIEILVEKIRKLEKEIELLKAK